MNHPQQTILRVAEGGRIVIPAEVRQRLDMEVGSELLLTVQDDHATLTSAKAARKKAQKLVRRYVPAGSRLSQELMTERKAASRRE
jgi:AbrB family looped-hinge helix DNA binding protein